MKYWLIRKTLQSILPATDELPPIPEEEWDDFLGQFHREAPPIMRAALWAAVTAYNAATPITVGVPLPAAVLPQKLSDLHAQRAAYHRIYLLRQVVLLLKTIGGMCWGAHPTIRAHLGLSPYASDPGTWRQA